MDAHIAKQKLIYSRMEMLYSASRSFHQQVFTHGTNNISLIAPIISKSRNIPVRVTNRVKTSKYLHVRPRNLVKVNISSEGCYGDKTRNTDKLHLSVLNARSVNNKSLLIKDYVVNNQIDI